MTKKELTQYLFDHPTRSVWACPPWSSITSYLIDRGQFLRSLYAFNDDDQVPHVEVNDFGNVIVR